MFGTRTKHLRTKIIGEKRNGPKRIGDKTYQLENIPATNRTGDKTYHRTKGIGR
jgi:hypothetical protein